MTIQYLYLSYLSSFNTIQTILTPKLNMMMRTMKMYYHKEKMHQMKYTLKIMINTQQDIIIHSPMAIHPLIIASILPLSRRSHIYGHWSDSFHRNGILVFITISHQIINLRKRYITILHHKNLEQLIMRSIVQYHHTFSLYYVISMQRSFIWSNIQQVNSVLIMPHCHPLIPS